jgi:hypothetical protein
MLEEKMIGYCGVNCHLCAARSDDIAVRQKLVDGWRKFFGHEMYTAENVKCDGCLGDGKIADPLCKIRPCALEKKIQGFAYCDDLPCEKIERFIMHRYGFMLFWRKKMSTMSEEEYRLCIRQFDNLKNLTFMLVDAGKLPEWVRKY